MGVGVVKHKNNTFTTMQFFTDGIHVEGPAQYESAPVFASPLSVASGGTGNYTFGSGQLLWGQGTANLSSAGELVWDNSSKVLTAQNLTVTGRTFFGAGTYAGGFAQAYTQEAHGLTITGKTGTTNDFLLANGVGTKILEVPTGTVNVNFSGGISIANPLAVSSGGTGASSFTSGYVPYYNGSALADSSLVVSSGNLGIGTTTPAFPLAVTGTPFTSYSSLQVICGLANKVTAYNESPKTSILFNTKFASTGGTADVAAVTAGKENNTDANKNGYLSFHTRTHGSLDIGERMRITSNGGVGIGTTTPAFPLAVTGTPFTNYSSLQVICGLANKVTAYNESPKASILFNTKYTASGGTADVAAVTAGKENNTDVNANGYLSFHTRTHGSLDIGERMRITSNGDVGIGTATPTEKLDVAGNINFTGALKQDGVDILDAGGTLNIRDGNGAGGYDLNQITLGYNPSGRYRHAIKTRHYAYDNTGNAIDFFLWKTADDIDAVGTHHAMSVSYLGVGIGGAPTNTTSTLHTLEVVGNTYTSVLCRNTSSDVIAITSNPLGNNLFSSNTFELFVNSNTKALFADLSGKLGIGTTSPSEKLDVAGNIVNRMDSSALESGWAGYIKLINSRDTTTDDVFMGVVKSYGYWCGGVFAQGGGGWRQLFLNAYQVEGGVVYGTPVVAGRIGVGAADPSELISVYASVGSGLDGTIKVDTESASVSSGFRAYLAGVEQIRLYSDVNVVGLYGVANKDLVFKTNSTERLRLTTAGVLYPNFDNTQSLGQSSNRWSEIFAGNGTINTSDAREKTEIRQFTADELNAAKLLANEIGLFKFLSSVALKGEAARNHVGMTVQRAIEIMQSCNLDPFAYGFICYDEWERKVVEHPEIPAKPEIPAQEFIPAVIDPETGKIISAEVPAVEYSPAVEAVPAWTEVLNEAGNRYGFRYDQLTLFMAKGFYQMSVDAISGLQAQIDALKSV